MSFVNKLMFWKKEDDFSDFGFDDLSNQPTGTGLTPDSPPNSGLPSHENPLSIQQNQEPEAPQQVPGNDSAMGMYTQQQPNLAGYPPQQSHPQSYPSTQNHNIYILSKNIEIVSSKIDALRASVDALSQRVANIERIAQNEEEHRTKGW